MINNPLLSIIIPVYNSERFLKECLDSVLFQSFSDFEVIVVDDGSTDSSIQIEEEYSKDSRFVIISQSNAGQGAARNRALDIAKGKYITFLDSDDAMKPDFLKETLSKIEDGKYDIVVTNYDYINEQSEFLGNRSNKRENYTLDGYEALLEMFYDENVHIGPWAKLYKREVFEKERFKSCYCEDADILERIIKKNQSILYISDSLFKYRIRNDADTWVFKPRTYEQIAVFDNMYLFAKENYPSELIGALKAKMMSVWFHVLLQLPKGDKRADELKKRIKENRRAVLKDNRIRNKTRIACLSSFLGFSVVCLFFCFVKRAGG